MRLVIGRSHVVPHSGHPHLPRILDRLALTSPSELQQHLTL